MEITQEELDALRTSFRSDFQAGYTSAQKWASEVYTRVPSTSAQNDYGWMAQLPNVREWLGPRVINNLAQHHYAIANRTWENTVGIRREDFEDDNLGIYSPLAQSMGESWATHPDQLLAEIIEDNPICFDGQNFFDTDHPVDPNDAGSATYANTDTGLALTSDNWLTVVEAMAAFTGDSERPLGAYPNACLIPTSLLGEAKKTFENRILAGGSGEDNPTFGMAKIIVAPQLSAGYWYALDLRRSIRPFVFQERRAPQMQMKSGSSDPNVLEHNQIRMYSDARYNMGVTLPFLAYKAQVSA